MRFQEHSAPARHSTTVYIVAADERFAVVMKKMLATAGRNLICVETVEAFFDIASLDYPACLLLSAGSDGEAGLDIQRRLNQKRTALPLIFFCGSPDIKIAVNAFKAGAFDFLQLPVAEYRVSDAVKSALQQDRDQRASREYRNELQRRYTSLSTNESQVMTLLMDGLLSRQIARVLQVTEILVRCHRASIMEKMSAKNLVELVRMDAILHPRASVFSVPRKLICAGELGNGVPLKSWLFRGAMRRGLTPWNS